MSGGDQGKECESITESALNVNMGQQRMLSYRFPKGCGGKRQKLQIMMRRKVIKTAHSMATPTTAHHTLTPFRGCWPRGAWYPTKVQEKACKEK